MRREPDFVIGPKDDPYLRRWWVIPRNRWFNIYLHEIRHSDDDRALHDHPWANLSIILKGAYYEHTPCGLCGEPACSQTVVKYRTAGSVVLRCPKAAHRLVVTRPTWTLFVTGPRVREWGFWCRRGWVLWTDFVAKDDHGSIGKGCGE